jgi:RHH-type proline utilization regulon transcriptional repressor/proline dehydrogenase/delta 1-pyrroline-5-carboxylate dehydrogenase
MDLYAPERRNSAGLDLTDRAVLDGLARRWARPGRQQWSAAAHRRRPLIGGRPLRRRRRSPIRPTTAAWWAEVVEASGRHPGAALAAAAQHAWAATPVVERAAVLDRMADLMERDRARLMALCVREAGKTIPDALAEVREAVDFCRYYAARARETFRVTLPGPTGERTSSPVRARRVRLHQPVELPAGHLPRPGRGRAGRRQRGGRQARPSRRR